MAVFYPCCVIIHGFRVIIKIRTVHPKADRLLSGKKGKTGNARIKREEKGSNTENLFPDRPRLPAGLINERFGNAVRVPEGIAFVQEFLLSGRVKPLIMIRAATDMSGSVLF